MVNKKELNDHLDKWLQGIYSEISFWNKHIRERGGVYKAKWKETISRERKFTLEQDIPIEKYGQEYDFIDVGSGPFSRCGFITDKVTLNHCAVDPLAEIYKILKKRDNVENGINLHTGFVELLDKEFLPNSFDLVHMSNSLDHSFDAVMGIYQLINICRIGGKVILRHKQNEALIENYEGFHQWNLYVDVENNRFTVWRADEKYDINELLSEYVDIRCLKDPYEDIFYRVELLKKKDIVIPDNDIYDIMLGKIYNYMLKVIAEDVFKNVNSPKSVFIEKNMHKIESFSEDALRDIFQQNGWNKISIYGLGVLGQKLYDRFEKTDLEIVDLIDERNIEYKGHKTVRLEDCSNLEKSDVIVVTTFDGFEQIQKNIMAIGYRENIVSIAMINDFAKADINPYGYDLCRYCDADWTTNYQ